MHQLRQSLLLSTCPPCPQTFNGPQCHQDTQDNFQSQGPCEWLHYEMLADGGTLAAGSSESSRGLRAKARGVGLGHYP